MKKILDQLEYSARKLKHIWVDAIVSNFFDVRSPSMGVPTVRAVQVDNTLNPGTSIEYGKSYILTNVSDLHANFIVPANVADNDIVTWTGRSFIITMKAADATAKGLIVKTYVTSTNEEYVFAGSAWAAAASGFDNTVPIPGEDGTAYDTTIGQITANTLFTNVMFPLVENSPHADIRNVFGSIEAFGAKGMGAFSVIDFASSENGIFISGIIRDNAGTPVFDNALKFAHDGTTHLDAGVLIVGGFTALDVQSDGSALTVDHTPAFQKFANIPTYADNAAAIAGLLPIGCIYKTATGEVRIVV